MAKNNNNSGHGNNSNNNPNKSDSGGPLEIDELDAEDYAIIGAGLTALGDFFAFLSLVKAKQVTKQTGGQADLEPVLFIRSRKKAVGRKARPRR
ncbi:hypothetical protein [Paenibacillus sp. HW567]|uniref:hypothetical protein n=1 Tax=Paenibacillus sp. HW567 TaxID=1034769 RepID=UPI0003706EDD|nr:hypothetical protein [Paenibacillus sp. HW567]